jgi:urease subunit alpha
MAVKLTRQEYCDMYGPTAGDKIHLADTGLIAEIEKDYAAACYGNELMFGGGKTNRDGMGNISGATTEDGVLDTVFANAIIIDPMIGIVKGDIGVKDGKIVGIG